MLEARGGDYMDEDMDVGLVDAIDDAIVAMRGAAAALPGREEYPEELTWLVAYVLDKCAANLAQEAGSRV